MGSGTVSIEIKETALQEKANLEAILQKKLAEKSFLSAIRLAQVLNLSREKIRDFQELALKQMAFEYRNAIAVRNLAREWGFAREDLQNLLYTGLKEHEEISEKKRLEQVYDTETGRYLTLRQWVDQFFKAKIK